MSSATANNALASSELKATAAGGAGGLEAPLDTTSGISVGGVGGALTGTRAGLGLLLRILTHRSLHDCHVCCGCYCSLSMGLSHGRYWCSYDLC